MACKSIDPIIMANFSNILIEKDLGEIWQHYQILNSFSYLHPDDRNVSKISDNRRMICVYEESLWHCICFPLNPHFYIILGFYHIYFSQLSPVSAIVLVRFICLCDLAKIEPAFELFNIFFGCVDCFPSRARFEIFYCSGVTFLSTLCYRISWLLILLCWKLL